MDYANVRVRPIADDALVLRPEHIDPLPVPAMTWSVDGPARYHVHVRGVRRPFVLALADAFSPAWRVRGLPSGASARQVEIDGYRNGWTIDAHGDLDLTIEYAPARYGRDAMLVSEIAALLFALSFLVTWHRRRRGRWPGVALWARLTGREPPIDLSRLPAGARRVSLDEADLAFRARNT